MTKDEGSPNNKMTGTSTRARFRHSDFVIRHCYSRLDRSKNLVCVLQSFFAPYI
jgi:hypothetical protein